MLALLIVVTLFFGALGKTDLEKVSLKDYPVETHSVTTEDGYILRLVRIKHGQNSTKTSKGVVFLMHGLPFSSISFTYLGSEYGIAQNLADNGYDVWMGNARGNFLSRNHISKNPDEPSSKFFDFTLDDLSCIDLPTMIDYVLEKTGKAKLHYCGQSLGGTMFYILNSMKPEYQSKFASANLLSGLGSSTAFPSKVVKTLCSAIDIIYTVSLLVHYVEFKADSFFTKATSEIFMATTIPWEVIGGASVKQVTHYCQIFRDSKFRRFNYGAGNFLKYFNVFPPSYDLSKIRVNTTLHYSVGDSTQSETDALLMAQTMKNARARKIPRAGWSQLDYITNPEVKHLVTEYILESMENSVNL